MEALQREPVVIGCGRGLGEAGPAAAQTLTGEDAQIAAAAAFRARLAALIAGRMVCDVGLLAGKRRAAMPAEASA